MREAETAGLMRTLSADYQRAKSGYGPDRIERPILNPDAPFEEVSFLKLGRRLGGHFCAPRIRCAGLAPRPPFRRLGVPKSLVRRLSHFRCLRQLRQKVHRTADTGPRAPGARLQAP
jgi:hypothetical protein